MSTPNGPGRQPGPRGEREEPIVVRDRRRIDPVTGEVRDPAGEQPAGASPGRSGPAAGARASASAQTTKTTTQSSTTVHSSTTHSTAHASGQHSTGSAPEGAEARPGEDPRVGELATQLEERTADLQRITAEYANYRRRVDRDRESVLLGAKISFVTELLTVLDDLERAEQHGDLNGPFKAVADKIVGAVTRLGLESFGAVDEPFDPKAHEAVQHEPAAEPGPTVTVLSGVLRRGYRIGERVLRPAMVTVVDRPEGQLAAGAPNPAAEPVPVEENDES